VPCQLLLSSLKAMTFWHLNVRIFQEKSI